MNKLRGVYVDLNELIALRIDENRPKMVKKWVPKILTVKQKELHRQVCQDLLEHIEAQERDWIETLNTDSNQRKQWAADGEPRVRAQLVSEVVRSNDQINNHLFFFIFTFWYTGW